MRPRQADVQETAGGNVEFYGGAEAAKSNRFSSKLASRIGQVCSIEIGV